jgi:UBX domain-containing protein 1
MNKPHTTVQIRLADGTRLVTKVNLDHTVGHLRRFISASRPSDRQFSLNTTFPMKVYNDDSISIKESGLCNAVIVQKWL